MTLSKFAEILRRFGPVVDKWPPELIEPALTFLHESDDAKDLFARASSTTSGGARLGASVGGLAEADVLATGSKARH